MHKNDLIDARKNAVSYYLFFTANSILAIFLSPILLNYLGAHSFGIWKTCQRLFDFLAAADGRSSQALKFMIVKNSQSDDEGIKQRFIGASIYVSIIFSPIFLGCLISMTLALPHFLEGLRPEDISSLKVVGWFLSLNIVLTSMLGIPDAVLMGMNKGRLSVFPQTWWLICTNIAMGFAAIAGASIASLAIITAASAGCNFITIYWITKKKIQWWGVQYPCKGELSPFFKFSSWMLFWSIVEKLILSTEILLIAYLINPVAVTKYTFTSYIPMVAIAICLLSGSSVMPTLGKLIVGEGKALEKFVSLNRQAILGLATGCAIYIVFFNKSFVTVWAGSEQYLGFSENLAIGLIFLVTAIVRNEGQMHDVLLEVKLKVIAGAISIVMTAVLAYYLCIILNFEKVVVILYSILFLRIPLVIIFSNYFNSKAKIKEFNYKKIIISFFLVVVSSALGDKVELAGWFQLIFASVIFLPLSIAIIYIFILDDISRALVKTKAMGYIKK